MTMLPARCRSWTFAALCAVLALVLATPLALAHGQGATGARAAGTAPAMPCASVARLDLGGIPGAPTEITAAQDLPAAANTLGAWDACDVKGVIAPQIQFELRLPTAGWQGNYLQVGCGGNCGSVNTGSAPASYGCAPLTAGAYAVASDNEGHDLGSGLFSADPTLKVDFGYASEHELALAAKQIIADYYRVPAAHSYYDGCSQGGHEALTEAQRYPADFNGIVAGAPANNWTALNVFSHAWNAQAVFPGGGRATLTTADLAPLHAAVLTGCGATDGVIADPLGCAWDPASIRCRTGQTATPSHYCLTAAQVATVRKLYSGPRDRNGRSLYPGWQLRGSELNWAGVVVPATAGTPSFDATIATETIRYQIFPSPQPRLTYRDVRFDDAFFRRIMRISEGTMDATDPDLSAFRAAGGKLILWHGLGDQHIPAVGTMAYYQAVEDVMGGPARTAAFARLFLLPGVAHCGGGQGPDGFDALGAVADWVTRGRAPARLLTSRLGDGGTVTATRPVYPYPYVAVDTTGGDPAQAGSYTPRLSTAERDLRVDYVGAFRSGYETVSGWVDGRWVTRPGRS